MPLLPCLRAPAGHLLLLLLAPCSVTLSPAALAATPDPANDDSTVPPRDPLVVRWVHARPAGSGLAVSGFVSRSSRRAGPLSGYVRVMAAGSTGGPPVIACLRSRDLHPAGNRGDTFHLLLPGATDPTTVTAQYARQCP